METDEALEGVLYVDGHVNLYYGNQTQMPKRFVSRLRLCMSGSTDYWINDLMGAPFFVVHKTLNDGMISVLKEEIIPRLNRDVPNQPTQAELDMDDKLHRYMLVFDREGYSIDFFKYLTEHRVAFCTYRKNVKEDWPQEEFADCEVVYPDGETETMQLAERQTVLYGKKKKGEKQYAGISLQNKEMSKKEIDRYVIKKNDMQLKIEDLEKQRITIIEKKKTVDKKNIIQRFR